VVASVSIANPDALNGELFVGLRCRRNQRAKGVTHDGVPIEYPLIAGTDRKQLVAEWRPLSGRGPWQVRFAIPEGAPTSKGDGGRNAWRVEVREQRSGGKDPAAHASFIVR